MKVVETLYESSETVVQRVMGDDGVPMILKRPRGGRSGIRQAERLKHEFAILRMFDCPEVVKAVCLTEDAEGTCLLLEDIGGQTLRELAREGRFQTEPAKRLGLLERLARILTLVHAKEVLHKDVNPSNFVYNEEIDRLQIIDFGISRCLVTGNEAGENRGSGGIEGTSPTTGRMFPRSQDGAVLEGTSPTTGRMFPRSQDGAVLEGTFQYISPEQTGRTSRSPDKRSDLYSLGVTVFELTMGILPFRAESSSEWIQCHLAMEPRFPRRVARGFPTGLLDLIRVLLAKDPEDRYQSAFGVAEDLRQIRELLETPGGREKSRPRAGFVPRRFDVSDRFEPSRKRYGRASEAASIRDFVVRSEKCLLPPVLVIEGPPGVGKTFLLNEALEPLEHASGIFLKGKGDPHQLTTAFFALGKAFAQLPRLLMLKTGSSFGEARAALKSALGARARLFLELAPECELIFGSQPALPEVNPIDAGDRILRSFLDLLSACHSLGHPITLCLDDCQWLDSATVDLLDRLTRETASGKLSILGTVRSPEPTTTAHWLKVSENWAARAGALTRISLGNLEIPEVGEFLRDTLRGDPEKLAGLTSAVYGKTAGNPFFFHQFLTLLHNDGMVAFSPETKSWTWDLSAIQAASATDNVADILKELAGRFHPDMRRILRFAASLGTEFDGFELASILGEPARELEERLRREIPFEFLSHQRALGAQTPFPANAGGDSARLRFRFAHDHIRQACFDLGSDRQIGEDRAQIGLGLYRLLSAEHRSSRLLEIASHLERGSEHIKTPEDRSLASVILTLAGESALRAVSCEPALSFFDKALALAGPESWENDRKRMFALSMGRMKVLHFLGFPADSEKAFQDALNHARDLLERVSFFSHRLSFIGDSYDPNTALSLGKQALADLGVPLFESSGGIDHSLWMGLSGLKRVRALSDEEILGLPVMTVLEKRLAIDVLHNMFTAAFHTHSSMYPQIVNNIILLTLDFGIAPESAIGFALMAQGVMLASDTDPDESWRMGRISISLAERVGDRRIQARALDVVGPYSAFWKRPNSEVSAILLDGYKWALEGSDFPCSVYCLWHESVLGIRSGRNLQTIRREIEGRLTFFDRVPNFPVTLCFRILRQTVLCLVGETSSPTSLNDDRFDEKEALAVFWDTPIRPMYGGTLQSKCMIHYFFREFDKALDMHRTCMTLEVFFRGYIDQPEREFYGALTKLALLAETPAGENRLRFEQETEASEAQFEKWVRYNPTAFRHKLLLLKAERLRRLKMGPGAPELYLEGIRQAESNGFIHEAALGHELLADFWAESGWPDCSLPHARRAHEMYSSWGAGPKALDVIRRFPNAFEEVKSQEISSSSTVHSRTLAVSGRLVQSIDLAFLLKAFTAIKETAGTGKLESAILRLSLKAAGATRAMLFLPSGDEADDAGPSGGKPGFGEDGSSPPMDDGWILEAEGRIGERRSRTGIREKVPFDPEAWRERAPLSLLRQTLATGRTLVIGDASEEEISRGDPFVRAHSPRSIMFLPLYHRATLAGLMYLEHDQARQAFPKDRQDLLEMLASKMGMALENARLFDRIRESNRRLRSEIAERKAAQRKLVVSERFYRGALQNLSEVIILSDRRGRVRYLSPNARKVFPALRNPSGRYPSLTRLFGQKIPRNGDFEVHLPQFRGKIQKVFLVSNRAVKMKEGKRLLVMREITERREMVRQILSAGEEERERLGRELHDDLCQQISGCVYLAGALKSKVRAKTRLSASDLEPLVCQLHESLEQGRALSKSLCNYSEFQTSHELFTELGDSLEGRFGIACKVKIGKELRLSQETTSHLVRIIQEAVHNAVRHGRAESVAIEFHRTSNGLSLSVSNDGLPFETKPGRQTGIGLRTMRYRALLLGGSLEIENRRRKGVCLTVEIPLRSAED